MHRTMLASWRTTTRRSPTILLDHYSLKLCCTLLIRLILYKVIISLWIDIRWPRRRGSFNRPGFQIPLQYPQSVLNNVVTIIEFIGTIICVDGILDLIIAGFVKCAEIEPDLGDIRV